MIGLFLEMKQAQFQLVFNGPAVRNGTMEAGELASSLLAISDLMRSANRQLNADRADISVKVKADFESGSFDVALLLDQTLLEQAKNILIPGTKVLGAAAILRLVFGTEAAKKGALGALNSVLDIWKRFKGDKPKEVLSDQRKGITIFVTGDNNKIDIDSNAAMLYEKEDIRSSISGMVRPLVDEGMKTIDIRNGPKRLNVVSKSDLPPSMKGQEVSSDSSEAKVLHSSREAVLKVTRPNFEKGKWGFSDGEAKFSADITDESYKAKLDEGSEGFYSGDTLRVILRTSQIADGQTIQTKYEIERVINHRHHPKQTKLLE